jgi:hypothetical protein
MSSGEIDATSAAPRWTLPARIAFRFFFPLFLLYLPVPLLTWRFEQAMMVFWNAIVPPVARTLFGVRAVWQQNGSGDTTWDWVQLFAIVVISLAIMVVWSLLDRRRPAYPRLYVFLRVYVRFSLAAMMLSYGISKVIPMQFPPPGLDRLMQPFGEASPMGLLWTFMGASKAYTIFAGAGEVIGAVLLTMRRTALLGALVSAAVMTNVVMLNFSYDVPVKIFSSMLLLAALFIAAPDARRLLNLLVLNRPADPAPLRPAVRPPWLHHLARLLRTAFVIVIVVQGFRQTLAARGNPRPNMTSALHGVWNVDELTVDGVPHPPLLTDETRWRRVVFNGNRSVMIQFMSDRRERYGAAHDNTGFILKKRDDPLWQGSFFSERPNPQTLRIHGFMDGRKIAATLHKVPEPKFLLTTRGFHWINETPFNR